MATSGRRPEKAHHWRLPLNSRSTVLGNTPKASSNPRYLQHPSQTTPTWRASQHLRLRRKLRFSTRMQNISEDGHRLYQTPKQKLVPPDGRVRVRSRRCEQGMKMVKMHRPP